MIKITDKGEPLNADFYITRLLIGDDSVVGRGWCENGKWYFLGDSVGDTIVYEVDKDILRIIFAYPIKEPKYN